MALCVSPCGATEPCYPEPNAAAVTGIVLVLLVPICPFKGASIVSRGILGIILYSPVVLCKADNVLYSFCIVVLKYLDAIDVDGVLDSGGNEWINCF